MILGAMPQEGRCFGISGLVSRPEKVLAPRILLISPGPSPMAFLR
jgi:hypothetical protein